MEEHKPRFCLQPDGSLGPCKGYELMKKLEALAEAQKLIVELKSELQELKTLIKKHHPE
jgi:hypothetical protein